MEILYQRGKASASDVREAMNDAPAIRRFEPCFGCWKKGHIKHESEGLKYVYAPVVNRDRAKRSAVKQLVDTFFRDSPEQVVASLLDVSSRRLTPEELDRMAEMIDKARKEGK